MGWQTAVYSLELREPETSGTEALTEATGL